jgi:hypothetical protein
MVSAPEGLLLIAITVAYISAKINKNQDDQSFTYVWPWGDDSLIVILHSLDPSTSLSDMIEPMIQLNPIRQEILSLSVR